MLLPFIVPGIYYVIMEHLVKTEEGCKAKNVSLSLNLQGPFCAWWNSLLDSYSPCWPDQSPTPSLGLLHQVYTVGWHDHHLLHLGSPLPATLPIQTLLHLPGSHKAPCIARTPRLCSCLLLPGAPPVFLAMSLPLREDSSDFTFSQTSPAHIDSPFPCCPVGHFSYILTI